MPEPWGYYTDASARGNAPVSGEMKRVMNVKPINLADFAVDPNNVEGIYTMTTPDRKTIGVPFSKVPLAKNSGLFLDPASASQYAKDASYSPGPLDSLASWAGRTLPYVGEGAKPPGKLADFDTYKTEMGRRVANVATSIIRHSLQFPAAAADSVMHPVLTPRQSIERFQARAAAPGSVTITPEQLALGAAHPIDAARGRLPGYPRTTESLDEDLTNKVGALGMGVLLGTVGGSALETAPSVLETVGPKFTETWGTLRDAAVGDRDAALLRGLRVPFNSKEVDETLMHASRARPYFQGAQSLKDLQQIFPQADEELQEPYREMAKNAGHHWLMGPDGPATIANLEAERSQLAATNRKTFGKDSVSVSREQALAHALSPALHQYGFDPQAIQNALESVRYIGDEMAQQRTNGELLQPYGLGKLAGIPIPTSLSAPSISFDKAFSGSRDIIAGRPLLRGNPTDIGIREGFAKAGPKPDLGTFRMPESDATTATDETALKQPAPTRGPNAWMAKGASRLADLGIDEATLTQMRASKDGQNLLMNASGVAPGTVRMNAILREIQQLHQPVAVAPQAALEDSEQ